MTAYAVSEGGIKEKAPEVADAHVLAIAWWIRARGQRTDATPE
jgi:hypothetical protein